MPDIRAMICTKCGISKPFEEFAVRPKRRNGRQGQCKQCVYNRVKAWRVANPEEYKAKYAAANFASETKRAQWRKNNIDRMKAYSKEYYNNNPDKVNLKRRRRRALEAGARHEPYKDSYIYERDGWICGICGQKINKRLRYPNPRSRSVDHIVPLSAGGIDAVINLQAAHLRCNQSKATKSSGQLRLIG